MQTTGGLCGAQDARIHTWSLPAATGQFEGATSSAIAVTIGLGRGPANRQLAAGYALRFGLQMRAASHGNNTEVKAGAPENDIQSLRFNFWGGCAKLILVQLQRFWCGLTVPCTSCKIARPTLNTRGDCNPFANRSDSRPARL